MAVLDTSKNEVVIRIVYDGPPEAGKTTSIRALAASFGQSTVTPEENAAGRTQWFDWMEYVGGRFEGAQIRCQVVSVPGQRELGRRREALLAAADVIVFVGDTTPLRWPVTIAYLSDLYGLRDDADAAVGIVFQANKRNVPGAVPLDEVRSSLGNARWQIGIVESIATDGTGIREAFVYGVRLALDRVRELIGSGKLREGRPEQLTPHDLFADLQAAEAATRVPPPPASSIEESLLAVVEDELEDTVVQASPRIANDPRSVAATLIQEVLAAETLARPQTRATPPLPPDASVPSGAIWPPVEGRAMLSELAHVGLASRHCPNGDWSAGLGTGWRMVSKQDAIFDSLDAGRHALVQWARLHAACTSVISARRCIVLAATGDGRWRLWQIVRAEPTLRDHIEHAGGAPTEAAIDSLWRAAHLLVEFQERAATAPCELLASLDTVGVCESTGLYVGLMPESPYEPGYQRLPAGELLAAELGPMLAHELAERRADLASALGRRPLASTHRETVLASLQRLLVG